MFAGLRYRVTSIGFFRHEKRFSVFPRVCKTDRTHIPIAAFSLLSLIPLPFKLPLRSLIVSRTFLIHEQSFLARVLDDILQQSQNFLI